MPRKRKASTPASRAVDANRKRIARAGESTNEAKAVDANRKRIARAGESTNKAKARKEANRLRMNASQASESVKQAQARKEANRLRMNASRASESVEQIQARKEANRLHMNASRASESVEQAQARKEANRLHMATSRSAPGLALSGKSQAQPIASTPRAVYEDTCDYTSAWIEEREIGRQQLPTAAELSSLCENSSFERDPRAALLLYHMQSGLLQENEDPLDNLELPAAVEIEQAVLNYNNHIGQEAPMAACAGCGQYFTAETLREETLGVRLQHLALPAEREDAYSKLSVEGRSAHHVVEQDGVLYCVAPSLLRVIGTSQIGSFCAKCLQLTPRSHSRFSDFDYGIPFPPLASHPFSPLNRLALARNIAYMVHVKLYSSSGRIGGDALKSHCFCVPHDGAKVVSDTIALNPGCLAAFTLSFIGSGSAFRALRDGVGFKEVAVQPDRSLQFLHYVKEAGHPQYRDLVLPSLKTISCQLHTISARATAAAEHHPDAILQCQEQRLPNERDGASALLSPAGSAASNAAVLKGIDDLVHGNNDMKRQNAPPQHAVDVGSHPGICVGSDLMNEFHENHLILGGLFPMEFTLGIPETYRKGHLPEHVTKRLLQAYIPNFEQCSDLVFFLFNQLQRHAASRSVAYYAKSGSKHMKQFKDLVQSPNFDAMLNASRVNPDTNEAHSLLRAMLPLLRTTSRRVPWSPGERIAELPKMYAICHRHGLPSDFITFSQLSAMSPLVIKIGSRRLDNNTEFVWTSSSMAQRFDIASASPATCAANFDAVALGVIRHLFGVDLDNKKEVLHSDRRGIFGSARACHAVTEAQARGSLHLHVLLWLKYGPIFFSRFVHTDDGQKKLREFVDATVSACLSTAEHETRQKQSDSSVYPAVISALPELRQSGRAVAANCNFHTHSRRCRKGTGGKTRCALAKRSPTSPATVWEQVAFDDSEEYTSCPIKDRPLKVLGRVDDPISALPPHGQPLPEPDGRTVCLTSQRLLQDDQLMVEYSDVLSGLLRCNTANLKLGAAQDAKTAMYYEIKYTSKNPCELQESLTLLLSARASSLRYRSEADDAGTPEREAKYLLSKLLNRMTGLQEFSSEQCAAALLGIPSSYSSIVPTYVYVRPAMVKLQSLTSSYTASSDEDSLDSCHSVTAPHDHDNSQCSHLSSDSQDVLSEHQHMEKEDEGDESADDSISICPDIPPLNNVTSASLPRSEDSLHSSLSLSATSDHADNLDAFPVQEKMSASDNNNVSTDDDDNPIHLDSLHNVLRAMYGEEEYLVEDEGDIHNIDGLCADIGGGENNTCTTGGRVDVVRNAMDRTVTFIEQHDDYYFRHLSIRFLNYLEFCALFQRVPKKKAYTDAGTLEYTIPESSTRAGRPCNGSLPFAVEHPLSQTHYLALRSRHFTPLLAGAPRPPWSHWRTTAKRRAFVGFYATLLIPWWPSTHDPDVRVMGCLSAQHYLDPQQFSYLMNLWSTGTAVERSRYFTFHNIVHNMNAPWKSRVISSKWRFRSADKWSDMDPSLVPAVGLRHQRTTDSCFDPAVVAAADIAIEQLQQDADRVNNTGFQDIRADYIEDIVRMHRNIYTATEATARESSDGDAEAAARTAPTTDAGDHNSLPFSDWPSFGDDWRKDAAEKLSRNKDESFTQDIASCDSPGNDVDVPLATKSHSGSSTSLNDGQTLARDFCLAPIVAGGQALVLLHGGPGTGKTYTASAIEQQLIHAGYTCCAASFMWSAVYQMTVQCHKSSIHNLLGQSPATLTMKKLMADCQWPATTIATVRLNMGSATVLIIDEISTVDLVLFVALDRILSVAYDSSRPFGGISIVMLGDFCQLPPPAGISVAEALAGFSMAGRSVRQETDAGKLRIEAGTLFMKFRRVVLTEQVRANQDEAHCRLLDRFALSNNDSPLNMDILAGLPRLSTSLLRTDRLFEDAPIAVQSNQERTVLNELQCLHFAMRHNEPVFRWVLPMLVGTAEYEQYPPNRSNAFITAGARELQFLFVRGMPLFLCSKVGHESWKVCNGRSARAHSFIHNASLGNVIPAAAKKPGAGGKVFDIPQPDYVNVEVLPMKSDPPHTPPLIIPVPAGPDKKPVEMFLKHAPIAAKEAMGHVVPSVRCHPIDPGFAITYNKLQGATVDRLVLVLHDLTACKLGTMTIQKIYVALSRVCAGKHLAIVPAQSNELHHLTVKHYPPLLRAWDGHYRPDGRWIEDLIHLL